MSNAKTPVTRIAMLIYPDFTALDLVGPHQILASMPGTQIDLVAKTRHPVITDRRLSITPDKAFDDCAPDYDILMVPGMVSPHPMIEDAETLSFVAKLGETTPYITSVCTGSIILAAAGLLKGYRATSHWAYRHFLADFGAIPEDARFVVDRNRITGGGITAGIDFGLQLASILQGEDFAKTLELLFEYDPSPPFNVGTPQRADAQTRARAAERMTPLVSAVEIAINRFHSSSTMPLQESALSLT